MKDIRRVRRISPADKELLAELKRIVLGFVPDATLVVYGSTARGERTPESDYDVLVLTDRLLSAEEQDTIGFTIYDLELARGVVITEVFLTREQWDGGMLTVPPFKREIENEAVLI
jgi:predicted nucleotidyltransferase